MHAKMQTTTLEKLAFQTRSSSPACILITPFKPIRLYERILVLYFDLVFALECPRVVRTLATISIIKRVPQAIQEYSTMACN